MRAVCALVVIGMFGAGVLRTIDPVRRIGRLDIIVNNGVTENRNMTAERRGLSSKKRG